MNSNQHHEGPISGRIDTTEDVEGHAASSNRFAPEQDDVEGHGAVSSRVAPGQDDVEGHGANVRV